MPRRASRGREREGPLLRPPRPSKILLTIAIVSLCASRARAVPEGPPAAGAEGRAAPRALPWRPSEWRYARGGEVEPPQDDARFWDRALLSASLGAANFEQMRPLLAKLRAGRPITVAAVGSSVVQVGGWALRPAPRQLWAARAQGAAPRKNPAPPFPPRPTSPNPGRPHQTHPMPRQHHHRTTAARSTPPWRRYGPRCPRPTPTCTAQAPEVRAARPGLPRAG